MAIKDFPTRKQHGCVLVFKEGTTEAQIAKALNSIKAILDVPLSVQEVRNVDNGASRLVQAPFRWAHIVHTFNPEIGGPVWYIP